MSPEISVEYTPEDDAIFLSIRYPKEEPEVHTLSLVAAQWLSRALVKEIMDKTGRTDAFDIRAPQLKEREE